MKSIEALIQEHEAVRRTLRILGKIADNVARTGTIPDTADVGWLLDFFRVFVDRCHHGKEEDFLFPSLEKVGVSREGGAIGVMLREHQGGREHVAAMDAALKQCEAGDPSASAVFARHAREYIAMLDQHIEKENRVLFPLAQRHLPLDTLGSLAEQFDTVEEERIGPGKHEAFHKMIDELERKYL